MARAFPVTSQVISARDLQDLMASETPDQTLRGLVEQANGLSGAEKERRLREIYSEYEAQMELNDDTRKAQVDSFRGTRFNGCANPNGESFDWCPIADDDTCIQGARDHVLEQNGIKRVKCQRGDVEASKVQTDKLISGSGCATTFDVASFGPVTNGRIQTFLTDTPGLFDTTENPNDSYLDEIDDILKCRLGETEVGSDGSDGSDGETPTSVRTVKIYDSTDYSGRYLEFGRGCRADDRDCMGQFHAIGADDQYTTQQTPVATRNAPSTSRRIQPCLEQPCTVYVPKGCKVTLSNPDYDVKMVLTRSVSALVFDGAEITHIKVEDVAPEKRYMGSDLYLYALNANQGQLSEQDYAMARAVTDKFGQKIWTRTLVALTMSNMVVPDYRRSRPMGWKNSASAEAGQKTVRKRSEISKTHNIQRGDLGEQSLNAYNTHYRTVIDEKKRAVVEMLKYIGVDDATAEGVRVEPVATSIQTSKGVMPVPLPSMSGRQTMPPTRTWMFRLWMQLLGVMWDSVFIQGQSAYEEGSILGFQALMAPANAFTANIPFSVLETGSDFAELVLRKQSILKKNIRNQLVYWRHQVELKQEMKKQEEERRRRAEETEKTQEEENAKRLAAEERERASAADRAYEAALAEKCQCAGDLVEQRQGENADGGCCGCFPAGERKDWCLVHEARCKDQLLLGGSRGSDEDKYKLLTEEFINGNLLSPPHVYGPGKVGYVAAKCNPAYITENQAYLETYRRRRQAEAAKKLEEKEKNKEKLLKEQAEVRKEQSESDGCHPADALVKVQYACELGRCVSEQRMDSVALGDLVEVMTGEFEPVLAITHRDAKAMRTYMRLRTASHTLDVTSNHYIFCNESMALPDACRIGDTLLTNSGRERIIAKTHPVRRGAYHVWTARGTLVVNGVLTSVMVSDAPLWIQRHVAPGAFTLIYHTGAHDVFWKIFHILAGEHGHTRNEEWAALAALTTMMLATALAVAVGVASVRRGLGALPYCSAWGATGTRMSQ